MTEPVEKELAPVDLENAAPTPEISGTFAIYNDGRGGYVLVTDTTDVGVTRKHIPAGIVRLAQATGGGMLGKLFGGK